MPVNVNVWDWSPTILVGLVAMISVYVYAAVYLHRRGQWGTGIKTRHVAFFATGVLTIFIAVNSPIDYIGENFLFFVHMIQHMLLAMVAPAFILLGIPRWMMHQALEFLRVGPLVKFVTHPVLAFIAFNTSLFARHVPALYEAALRDPMDGPGHHMVSDYSDFNVAPAIEPPES